MLFVRKGINMKKPASATIQSFIRARFVLEDEVGPFIPGTETTRLAKELMQNFEGIYCGAFPDKRAGKLFEVRSVKTQKRFASIRVK